MSACEYCEGKGVIYMGNNAPENQPCPVCELSEPRQETQSTLAYNLEPNCGGKELQETRRFCSVNFWRVVMR